MWGCSVDLARERITGRFTGEKSRRAGVHSGIEGVGWPRSVLTRTPPGFRVMLGKSRPRMWALFDGCFRKRVHVCYLRISVT